ncbi:protein kinase [Streptomyces sp. NPDC093600]|uniref:serine/threonine-protein kinase n=1 Tax=Streptomyces sp. NPDC093600 TaxID=3366047 RepID=UPI0037F9CB6A
MIQGPGVARLLQVGCGVRAHWPVGEEAVNVHVPGIRPLGDGDPLRLGDYRLLGRIGAGGMGRVYLAQTLSGRLIAVKTLLAAGETAEFDRRRFAREVALARRVTGVFTVAVVDADAAGDPPWMATEYVPAPSLAALVRDAGALEPAAAGWVAAGMAEALVDLHRAGVVHRDVKPGNVLLPLSGPRLIDFGISHATDLTRTSLTLGTIAFTSPEQARGEASTAKSDVYSMGATLFHLAVGRPPYAEDSDTLRLLTHVQRGELDLTGLPPELDETVRSCLSLDPAARPSPADVLRGLSHTADSGRRLLPARWIALIRSYEGPTGRSTPTERVPSDPPTKAVKGALAKSAEPVPSPARRATAGPRPAASRPRPALDDKRDGALRKLRRVLVALLIAVGVFFGGLSVYQKWYADSFSDNPLLPAFREIRAGNCLTNVLAPEGRSWTPEVPKTVDCDASEAYTYVQAVTDDVKGCDYSSNGTISWSNDSKTQTDRRYLCLTRQFRAGECVAGKRYVEIRAVATEEMWSPYECGTAAPGGGMPLRITRVLPGTFGGRESCGRDPEDWYFTGPPGTVCLKTINPQ